MGRTRGAGLVILLVGLIGFEPSPSARAQPAYRGGGTLGRGPLLGAQFSRDGKRLLTASGNLARAWDVDTGRELTRFVGHAQPIRFVTYGPDDRHVYTGGGIGLSLGGLEPDDFSARAWDAATGRQLGLYPRRSYVYVVLPSPDEARLLTVANDDNETEQLDARTGAALLRKRAFNDRRASHHFLPDFAPATPSPDGRLVLIRDRKGVVAWHSAADAEAYRLEGHTDAIRSTRFDPSGRRVLTASDDGTARLWDGRTGAPMRTFPGHDGAVLHATFGESGPIVTASADGTVRLWNPDTGAETRRFAHPGPVNYAFLNREGDRLLANWSQAGHPSNTQPTTASLWDVANGRELGRFPLRDFAPIAIFSHDGTRIYAATDPSTLRDAATGREIRRYE